MRIGIFFGGQSREREVSFAGGRTVYDNLNKSIFSPVPVFVDSLGNFILLDWHFLYKGTIRDFYPPAGQLPESLHQFQVYIESLSKEPEKVERSIREVGLRITPDKFGEHFDFAFLALHGPYGEDGNIQGLLEWYGIPYSGAGILPSSIGINKIAQKTVLSDAGFAVPAFQVINKTEWEQSGEKILTHIESRFGFPVVIKAPHQGSSIGVTIANDQQKLEAAINRSFFIQNIDAGEWKKWEEQRRHSFLVSFTDIREGLGFPIRYKTEILSHPEELWELLDQTTEPVITLESPDAESEILIESFVEGKEFSCIVIQGLDDQPIALPPTEIRKSGEVFDYRSKYLPGAARKVTPIELPSEALHTIISACEKLFSHLHSQVYARLDGFYTPDGKVILNDPNTTSGMMPSSFFFHQAAEIGLNPSQFLTYIIQTSLRARIRSGKHVRALQSQLDALHKSMEKAAAKEKEKIRVGVIMGGYSTERHISVESGRNIYEKLASSEKYSPIPIFLLGESDDAPHELYQLPVNMLLKDNADDIKEKIRSHQDLQHPVIERICQKADGIIRYFTDSPTTLRTIPYEELRNHIDFAFIALHGRPGEDGAVQSRLEALGIPYNGSGVESSQLTINKYETNEILAKKGILVADHLLVFQEPFLDDPIKVIEDVESKIRYPLIAKPADDGCSSAVKKIKNREELRAFAEMMFRDQAAFPEAPQSILQLKTGEEFPQKKFFLVEELITRSGADRFMEITGGVFTTFGENRDIEYQAFEPSEALATGDVLSLEEKFLAGEGQNITPARFGRTKEEYERISGEVKDVLIEAARTLKVEGYCRIDAFVRIYPDKVETVIIEINSLPGMTPATAIFHQAAINGLRPYDFIDQITEYGIRRIRP